MTDLTEQWKKGELPFGYYYVKFLNGKEGVKKLGEYAYRKLIKEVIDIVPSYDEWQASEKYNKHLEEKIKIYERKEKQHTDDAIAYNELKAENDKLKSILKECSEALLSYGNFNGDYELYDKITGEIK